MIALERRVQLIMPYFCKESLKYGPDEYPLMILSPLSEIIKLWSTLGPNWMFPWIALDRKQILHPWYCFKGLTDVHIFSGGDLPLKAC